MELFYPKLIGLSLNQISKEAFVINSVDEYIASFDPTIQTKLEAIRKIAKEEVPESTERICMKMPTVDLEGKSLVHYAAMKKHIGLYPHPSGVSAFQEQLTAYKTSKGAIQFPLEQALPLELIREIIRYRYNEQKSST